jgi:hypothetical protein
VIQRPEQQDGIIGIDNCRWKGQRIGLDDRLQRHGGALGVVTGLSELGSRQVNQRHLVPLGCQRDTVATRPSADIKHPRRRRRECRVQGAQRDGKLRAVSLQPQPLTLAIRIVERLYA